MDMKNELFIKVIESNLDQLLELDLANEVVAPLEKQYLSVLICYLRGEKEELSLFIENSQSLPPFFCLLVQIRLGILIGSNESTTLSEFSKFLEEKNLSEDYTNWKGEIAFVLGLAYLENKAYEPAKIFFQMAYRFLNDLGAKKKSVKSLLNVVVSESRLHNYKKLIIDYEFVAKKSLQAGDPIVAGICFLNISREFQLIGSLNLALKYVNKSIEHLGSDLGLNHYYSALLHRSHVLIDLGRHFEAQLDYETARLCPFPQIQEALKVIECMLGKSQAIATEKLDPTWKGRWKTFEEGKKMPRLTEMESRLLELIAGIGQTKEMLIQNLYGDKIDYSAAENRLKVLLSRFRKRHPGLIIFEENRFKFADEALNAHKVS